MAKNKSLYQCLISLKIECIHFKVLQSTLNKAYISEGCFSFLGRNTTCGQYGCRVATNYGKREPFKQPSGLSPIPGLSCYALAQVLQESLCGGTNNAGGLQGDRLELVPVHQGGVFAAFFLLSGGSGGARSDGRVDQRAGTVRVNARGVPYKTLSLVVWEHRHSVRPAAIPPVQANRLEPGRCASCSEGALHHVIEVGVTGKATSTVATRKPMVAEPVDAATASAGMRLAYRSPQPKCHGHPDSGVVKVEAQVRQRDSFEPCARVRLFVSI